MGQIFASHNLPTDRAREQTLNRFAKRTNFD